MKNTTGLFSMTDSSIQKLELTGCSKKPLSLATRRFLSIMAIFLGLLPLPTLAETLEVTPRKTEGDRVTFRIRVLDDNRIPIQGLKVKDLVIRSRRVYGEEESSTRLNPDNQIRNPQGLGRSSQNSSRPTTIIDRIIRFLAPEQTEANPADIVILLDMSGSMKHEDAAKIKKLNGAVDAIKEFLQKVRNDRLPFSIAIIPFGEECNYNYSVTQTIIENNLLSATDNTLDRSLNEYAGVPVCAQTNLYQPIKEAVKFLGNKARLERDANSAYDSENDLESSLQRRQAVIVLSDGFHVIDRRTEKQQFQALKQVLKQNGFVTVHTLGYGESLIHLRDRAICSRWIDDDELKEDLNNIINYCRLKEYNITEFIVDEKRLKEIAQINRGIHEFPKNAQSVAENLKKFLTTLREYELTFIMPNASRGSLHEVTVSVISEGQELNITSDPLRIRMDNIGYSVLSFPKRLGILISTIALGGVGVFSFKKWGKELKRQAEINLQ